jgi:HEAT repeat protein
MTPCSRLLAAGLVLALSCAAAASAQSVAGDRERQRNEGKDGKPVTIDEWSRDLANEDPLVRLKGVKMLSESTDAKAVPFLVQALGDPDLRVRAKAIDACATVRANDATPVLVQQLFIRGNEPELKQRILAALGKIGDPRASKPIMDFLGRDLDHATRGTAIYALGDIGDPESLEFLENLQGTEPHPTLKRLAREAVAKVHYQQSMKQTEAKEPLNTFLKNDEPPK